MVAADSGADQYKIHAVKTLRKPGQDEVKKQLEDAAAQVQPIMAKRKWTVPVLTEFLPNSPGLLGLNVNGGGGRTSVIKVRVRRGNDAANFYPYEHTLGTILHELVHNVIGPHSAKFYALLDEITQECEELMSKGIRGPGHGSFTGRSSGRLGGDLGLSNPPQSHLKDAIRKAAEGRMQRGGLASGARRLGGNSLSSKGMAPGQAAALAAERRAKDGLWCSCKDEAGEEGNDNDVVILDNCGSSRGSDGASTSHQGPHLSTDSGSASSCADVVDLTETTPLATRLPPKPPASNATQTIDLTDDRPSLCQRHPPKRPHRGGGAPVAEAVWACDRCTLVNIVKALECAACGWRLAAECTPAAAPQGGEGPGSSAAGRAKAGRIGQWECQHCSLMNDTSVANCAACGSWRYSRGPPVASAVPPSVNGMT